MNHFFLLDRTGIKGTITTIVVDIEIGEPLSGLPSLLVKLIID
jgi:hypothetical protein